MGNTFSTKKRILVVGLDGAGKFSLFYKAGYGNIEPKTALNNSMYYLFTFHVIF